MPTQHPITNQLRLIVDNFIKELKLTDDDLAEKLGLLPVGIEVLKSKDWTADEALHIASCLGIELSIRRAFKQCTLRWTEGILNRDEARPSGRCALPVGHDGPHKIPGHKSPLPGPEQLDEFWKDKSLH